MLKIKIDNEEVVSDKDFTIEEEMLNTPSVILNNVYPKTWEQDKDYTSRFYHPNDYSKCLITDETDRPGEPGSNVSGSSFNINVDTSKEYSFKFKGQNGVVSGLQNVMVSGKNMFDGVFRQGNQNYNTTTARIFTNNSYLTINTGDTITFSTDLDVATTYDYAFYIAQKPFLSASNTMLYNSGYKSTSTFTFTSNYSGYLGFTIRRKNEANLTPSAVSGNWFQIEKGSSATEYEAYNGNTYKVNLGMNLANIENIQVGKQWTGDYNSNRASILNIPIDPSTQYSIVGSWSDTHITQVRVVSFASIGASTHTGVFTGTFTSPSTAHYVSVEVIANTTFTQDMLDGLRVMFCKGSATISDYTPYKTPITLGANDEIYKSGNKWYTKISGTTTEITDNQLRAQLNVIRLLNGINNVSIVSAYLPMIMDLHYNYITPGVNVDLLFCGVVKNSGYISLNPRDPHYQTLQILDFKTFLSEGETLDFVIANKTIEEAIDQIISTISPYGFVKGNINILGSDTTIGAYSTKDKTAYDVFNYLADITQSRWTTRLVDENTIAVDFYDPTLLPQGTAINYTQQWFENNLIDDMTYNYGSNDYRNKQVMTSNEVIGSLLQSQVAYANGYQTQFLTEIIVATIDTINVNGVQKSVATNEQKDIGVEADFYYSPGSNIIESAITYSTGDVIEINYLPIVEGRQIITNNDEIERVSNATGRKGVVARYENRNDATTSNELRLIGQSYIKYKGTPEIKLTIQTRTNIWNIGDRVQFNAPITELDTEYMVKSKKTNYIATIDTIFYTFELTSSFNMEQDINYFDNQRAKAKGNIGEGEYITRNVDIENMANIIFYDSESNQVSLVGDNKLSAVLNSPLNN